MGETTKISWCDATWNPFIGCSHVSAACDNCYARKMDERWGHDFSKLRRTSNATFNAPYKWKDPKRVFVCSMSDFFHPNVEPMWRRDAMEVIERCPQHTFILLTKRPENIMSTLCGPHGRWGTTFPDNVWLGVTVENQEQANNRIPILLKVPAKVRFLSCEPLLESVNLENINGAILYYHYEFHPEVPGGAYEYLIELGGIDWIIVGAESGPHARPMDLSWARGLRDQCKKGLTKFFMKQIMDKGKKVPIEAWPSDLVIKEFPRGNTNDGRV